MSFSSFLGRTLTIFIDRRVHTIANESADQRQVHGVQLESRLDHGNSGDFDLGQTHEGYRSVFDKRWPRKDQVFSIRRSEGRRDRRVPRQGSLCDELNPKAHGTDDPPQFHPYS